MGINIIREVDGVLAHCRYVTLEGLIGAGKSTLLRSLKETAGSLFQEYTEPVDRWRAVSLGEADIDLLRVYYEHRNVVTSNLLQVYVSMSLYQQEKEIDDILARDQSVKIFSERNLSSSKYFIQGLKEMGVLDDAHAEAQMAFSHAFQGNLRYHPTKIFLDIPVEAALERVRRRGRDGEQCVDLNYLSVISRQISQDVRSDDYVLPFDELRSPREAAEILKRKLFSEEEQRTRR